MRNADRKVVADIKRAIGKKEGPLTWKDVDDYLKLQGSSLAELVEKVKDENGE